MTVRLATTETHNRSFSDHVTKLLVYLNGNNAAQGENNIKYASSYPMN